jgi:hypothetical protein
MVSWQLDFSTASHDPARLVVFSNKDRPDVSIPTEKPDVKEKEPYSFPLQVRAPRPYLLLAGAGGYHLHSPALLPEAALDIQAVPPVSFAPGVRVDLCLPGQAHATLHAPG